LTSDQEIDRGAVENIQKKLKILNKLQSSYRGQVKGYEIETVNEVFRFKKKVKNQEDGVGVSKNSKSLFRSFSFKNFRKKKKSSLKAPLLVLQTDDDGLSKLRQARKMKNDLLSKSKENIDTLEAKKSGDSLIDQRRNTSVTFDQCEISEQITSV
jgi:hypothetical protein